MSFRSNLTIAGSVGGVPIQGSVAREGSQSAGMTKTLPAAKTGTVASKTDADTGVITAQASHGIISTDKVNVFWTGGKRLGMTATVSTNDITVDGGAGDDLPVASTAVTIAKQIIYDDLSFDGTAVLMAALSCDQRAAIELVTAADAVLYTMETLGASEPGYEAAAASPIAGTVAKIIASNASTTVATLNFGILLT